MRSKEIKCTRSARAIVLLRNMSNMSRKTFIRQAAITAASVPFMAATPFHLASKDTFTQPMDEDYWTSIRNLYTLDTSVINLNNGGVSPQPLAVQDAHIARYRKSNLAPSFFMWRRIDEEREPLRKRLAEMVNCSEEELAINRNTTEGLNTIIFGLDLAKGDEVVLSTYDYPHMLNAWRQRELRDGIVLNYVRLDMPMESDDAIVERYRAAITPRTKVVHLTHVVNWTGQVVPAKRITEMAHGMGCEVVMDAAHSFAQFPLDIADIGCDYLATSLHKWLCAPFGTGLMFVRKEKIGKVWPLLSSYESMKDDIRKFETIGTRSFGAEMAIHDALDFHERIGQERKTARLRYLKKHWTERIKDVSNVRLYTSMLDAFSGGMATIGIDGWDGEEMTGHLFTQRKLHVTPVVHEQVNGVRISPHVYTSLAELDMLVDELTAMAKR